MSTDGLEAIPLLHVFLEKMNSGVGHDGGIVQARHRSRIARTRIHIASSTP